MKRPLHSRLRCAVALALAALPLWAGAALLVPGSPAPTEYARNADQLRVMLGLAPAQETGAP